MAELLRNIKGMNILDHASGRMKSPANPEVHIGRLAHFGAGMGVDLTGLSPKYSSKHMHVNRFYSESTPSGFPEDQNVDFDSHDEGLELPYGVLSASRTAINNTDAPKSIIYQAQREITHRSPYSHSGWGSRSPDIDHGVVDKLLNSYVHGPDHPTDESDIPLRNSFRHTEWWGSETGLSHGGAAQRTREAFRNLASIDRRVHGGFSPEAKDLMEHGLANPDPRSLDRIRSNSPHYLGPQFLLVGLDDPNISGPGFRDMIDLKTGTWAKIHPDEYFPD